MKKERCIFYFIMSAEAKLQSDKRKKLQKLEISYGSRLALSSIASAEVTTEAEPSARWSATSSSPSSSLPGGLTFERSRSRKSLAVASLQSAKPSW